MNTNGKTRIIVLEDNPADAELLRMALDNAGVNGQVSIIGDGADALRFFAKENGANSPVKASSSRLRTKLQWALHRLRHRIASAARAAAGRTPEFIAGSARPESHPWSPPPPPSARSATRAAPFNGR